jgi:hypothetical protein
MWFLSVMIDAPFSPGASDFPFFGDHEDPA